MLRKKAPASGINDLGSNIDKPGLIIINTPTKPIKIAIQIFNETFSLKIIADKATTIIGVKDATANLDRVDQQKKKMGNHFIKITPGF